MKERKCPKCQSKDVVKDGKVWGKQRYKCKECKYKHTRTEKRGKPEAVVNTAIILYIMGLSMNAIGRLLKVSTPAVLYWIKKAGKQLCKKPEATGEIIELELDEMWHYVKKKLIKCGYGKHTTEPQAILLTGNVAIVMLKPYKNSLIGLSNGM